MGNAAEWCKCIDVRFMHNLLYIIGKVKINNFVQIGKHSCSAFFNLNHTSYEHKNKLNAFNESKGCKKRVILLNGKFLGEQ